MSIVSAITRKSLPLTASDVADLDRLRAEGDLGVSEAQALTIVFRAGLEQLRQRYDEAGYDALALDPEWIGDSEARRARRHRRAE